VFKSPLFKVIVQSNRLLVRNSLLAFLKSLKIYDFLSFALIISSDGSQSKAQFDLQSLEENRLVTMLKT